MTYKNLISLLEQYKSVNWIRYTQESLKWDFNEYKSKEEKKWRTRAEMYGFRFPIFSSINDLKNSLDSAKIINLDKYNIPYFTQNDSIEDIKNMVSSYSIPRDVERIKHGFETGAEMPMPIILSGSKGMWPMAGNTRQATAEVLGYERLALLVNVND